MIYVTKGNEVEPLGHIAGLEMNEEVNGELTLSLASFNIDNNPAFPLVAVESTITIEDYDFTIKEVKQNNYSKEVLAESTFYSLNDKRQNEIYGGTRTFNEFAQFVFKGTNWTFTSSVQGSQLIPNFGENNVIALVQTLCQAFKCEYQILPNNRVHFSPKVGGDYDAQYRFKHNVKAISRHENTNNLKTYIEGFGAEDENGGGQLWVSYTSPNAAKFGKREADPIHDDRFTHADSLLEHIKSSIQDEPELSFELDAVELTNKELGERVWLIYEPLDIELQTRIMAQTRTLVDGKLQTTKVVLGNMIPKDFSDILISQKVEIDENKKITRSKFEQTNDRITMEIEEVNSSLTKLELSVGKFEVTINDKINGMQSQWTQTANQIKGEIKDTNDNVASLNLELDRFETSISNRVEQTESRITQTNNYIDLQVVKKSEYNGEDIISKINIQPDWIKIKAKNIELDGAVISKGSITGETTIRVGTDLYVGSDIYMDAGNGANSQIHFYPYTQIFNNYNSLFVQADDTLWLGGQYTNLQGQVSFRQAQSVDFSGVSVYGLNVSGGNADTVRGIYLAYNATYVYLRDQWGYNLAQLKRSDAPA